jgi:uncharacterized protein (DUF302 family)
VSDSGIISIPSLHSVDETIDRILELLDARGIRLFAHIDHSGEAEKAGLQMRPVRLLIFGNPKAGTPLMIASPTAGIDLPLKILVWENADRKVMVSYNSLACLQTRHGLPEELMRNVQVVEAIAAEAAR